MGTSTFAEATVMPEIALAKVNPDATLDVVCSLACGATTGIGAALYVAKVEPGSTCAVFGAGLVGLGAVAGCRLAGAERIIAVDLSEGRLEQARAQGATDTLVGGPGAVEQILEMTGGFGADYTFEATGNVAVMRQAVESARMGWGLCTVAGVAGKGEVLEVVPRFLITGRRIAGASFGGAKGRDRVPELVDSYLAGDLDLDALITQPHLARRGERRLRGDGPPRGRPHRHHLLDRQPVAHELQPEPLVRAPLAGRRPAVALVEVARAVVALVDPELGLRVPRRPHGSRARLRAAGPRGPCPTRPARRTATRGARRRSPGASSRPPDQPSSRSATRVQAERSSERLRTCRSGGGGGDQPSGAQSA